MRTQRKEKCAIVLVGVIVAMLIAGILCREAAGLKAGRHLKKLETYYQAADYAQMHACIRKWRDSGEAFCKYDRVAGLYGAMQYREEKIKEVYEKSQSTIDVGENHVKEDLKESFWVLSRIAGMQQEGYPYGEQAGAEYVREQMYSMLEQYFFLSETEIDAGVLLYDGDRTDYSVLAQTVAGRMNERRKMAGTAIWQEDIQ